MYPQSSIITIVVALFGGIIGGQAADQPSSDAKPKIKFDQTVYDFGKTSQVETVSGTFTFQNVGDAPLKMGKPSTSCGCTVAGVKPEVLQPGDKGELSFTLNLGRTRALLQKQITVETNDPDNPKVVLSIRAEYIPLYEVSPVTFYLTARQGESTNLTARVTRTDGKALHVAKLVPSQPWIEAELKPEPGSNQVARIELRLKAEGSARYFSELVNAFVEASDRPAFNVPISGRIIGDLVLTPESLYWPITDPEKALTTRRILVKSARKEKLELNNLSSSLTNVTVQAVQKDDGNTVELVATLAGIPSNTTAGVISFETNVPGQPKVQVPITINITKR